MSVKCALTLVRGIPGTGKSTLAEKIKASNIEDCEHYEADQFFETHEGYKFRSYLLPEAHQLCYAKTACAIYRDGKDVIVANTFCSTQEVQHYVDLAEKLLVNVVIIECTTEHVESPHGLTKQDMARFKKRWVPNSELRGKIKAENIKIFYITN